MRKYHRSASREAGAEPFFMPSDSLVPSQWHLSNTGQSGGTAGIDINAAKVWDDYTGVGVSVGIYDDAVDYNHPDLNDNYDASMHLVINGTSYSALPLNLGTSGDTHGTAVAGIIAAENNGVGSVGIAYGASITGVPILRSASAASTLDAMAQMGNFDIVNNSWGSVTPFSNNVMSSDPYWTSFSANLANAANTGRGGLGTIIVKSAGNSRGAGHETNYDNFTNDRHVIAVGAVDHNGMVSYYSTPGASLLIAAPSSNLSVGITTTDLSGTSGASATDYRSNFGGTSAAAPMISGVAALILDANPDLGWRDVQEILGYSARKVGSTGGSLAGYEKNLWSYNSADNWNGGGLHFSHDYGFGLVDALAAVRLAETWTAQSTSANEVQTSATSSVSAAIPDLGSATRTFTLADDIRIDHLELTVNITHPNRGDLKITLTSPDGTVSVLLDKPLGGTDTADNLVFRLGSNAFWGETSAGNWTVTVLDTKTGNTGTINSLTLRAYGDAPATGDNFIFTNEFAAVGGDPARALLSDADGGIDTLNAAAVTSASIIDLRAGMASTIAGRALTIAAGTVIENAHGGDGNDTLTGNALANLLYGHRGADMLNGGAGNDTLDGGTGSDTVQFAGARSRYTITSVSGGYRILDTLAAGDGSDVISGVERIQFSDGLYTVDGTLIDGEPLPPPPPPGDITGTAGNDTLQGGGGDERLYGLDGNDRLTGGAGADRLDGGAGSDTADFLLSLAAVKVSLASGGGQLGDAAGDVLIGIEDLGGSNLADELTGDGAANSLTGNGGNDILDGGAGADTLAGGAGNDTAYVDGVGDVVTENAGEGADTVIAALSWTLGANLENLILTTAAALDGTGNGLANTLSGNAAANILDGLAGNDVLRGNAGNDTLHGKGGADILEGGDGVDLLMGGAGQDDLTGGLGNDRFDFDTAADTATGSSDHILDFAQGFDKIDFSTFDAKAGTKKNDAFQFIGAAEFTGAAGQLRYQHFDFTGTANDITLIQADINGDRIADFELTLLGQMTALQAVDFVL